MRSLPPPRSILWKAPLKFMKGSGNCAPYSVSPFFPLLTLWRALSFPLTSLELSPVPRVAEKLPSSIRKRLLPDKVMFSRHRIGHLFFSFGRSLKRRRSCLTQ